MIRFLKNWTEVTIALLMILTVIAVIVLVIIAVGQGLLYVLPGAAGEIVVGVLLTCLMVAFLMIEGLMEKERN